VSLECFFQPSLIFAGRLLALAANIRLKWKGLPGQTL
jgi:hypothetical protein